jgi:hypothetical protein
LAEQTTEETEKPMKRRSFLGLSFLAFGIAPRLMWLGDEVSASPYAKTLQWFTALFRPLEELAAVVDRLRLLTYLRDLERVCDEMVSDKGEIATILSRKPLIREDLPRLLNRLRVDVELTQARVGRVRSVLREEFRSKGDDVSDELADRLRERKSWVQELDASVFGATDEQLSSFAKRVIGKVGSGTSRRTAYRVPKSLS